MLLKYYLTFLKSENEAGIFLDHPHLATPLESPFLSHTFHSTVRLGLSVSPTASSEHLLYLKAFSTDLTSQQTIYKVLAKGGFLRFL